MLWKAVPLLLTIGTALALMPLKPQVNANRSLMDFMLQSSGVGIGDPALQQYCFNRYLPILKAISDQYEADYNKCADTYKAECDAIDGKFYEPRENSARIAKETCDALLKCDTNENYLNAFNCYARTVSSLKNPSIWPHSNSSISLYSCHRAPNIRKYCSLCRRMPLNMVASSESCTAPLSPSLSSVSTMPSASFGRAPTTPIPSCRSAWMVSWTSQ